MTNRMQSYYPEMGEAKPACQGEASLSHYGTHYFIKTPVKLKTSRSVKHINTLKSSDLVPEAQHKVGWHEYKVTADKGMAEVKAQITLSNRMLLD